MNIKDLSKKGMIFGVLYWTTVVGIMNKWGKNKTSEYRRYMCEFNLDINGTPN